MDVTKDFIFEAAQRLEEFYSQRNTNMEVWRELALLTKESYWIDSNGDYKPPQDREVRIILPIAYNTIESYLSLMLTRPPVISVPTSDVREVHYKQADSIERMLYGIWSQSRMIKAIRDGLWHALVDGWGVLQVIYSPDDELKDRCPIYAKSVDPIGFYPMPSDRPGEWEYVILVSHRLVGELRNALILGKDGRTRAVRTAKAALENLNEDDRVKVLEYWDDEKHALMLIPTPDESEEPEVALGTWLLPPTKHEFGRIPFVIWHGAELPFQTRGERMGVSILFPMEQLVRYSCQLISQKATIIARYANPTLVTKTMEGRGFDVPQPYGGQLPLELDEGAEFLLPPETSPSVDIQLQEIIAQIEQAGLPRHIMGQLSVGRISGIAMNLLRTPVLMKVAYKQMAVEEGLERINELFLRAVESYVSGPIYLWGRDAAGEPIDTALDPEVIQGYYRNQVKLTASLPTDETAVTAMLTALKQLDILSSRTVRDIIQQTLRDLSSQSLEGEDDQILIEKLLSMPELQMALAQDAAQQAGVQLPMGGGQQGGAQQPMQGAIPGFGGGQGMAPQQLPWRGGGRNQPTTPDLIQRLAMQTAGAQGGRPAEGLGTPGAPTAVQGM